MTRKKKEALLHFIRDTLFHVLTEAEAKAGYDFVIPTFESIEAPDYEDAVRLINIAITKGKDKMAKHLSPDPRFNGVPVVQTEGITKLAKTDSNKKEIDAALRKFLALDYGDTCDEDVRINNKHIKRYDEIVALYKLTAGDIYIIADGSCDQNSYSVITILLPGEY